MLGIAESVIGVAGKVLDKFVEDKDLKTKLDAELRSQLINLDTLQAQTNMEQAKHDSIFVAGARPELGTEELTGLVMALLGLGAARSYEKAKGVARNSMNR